MSFWIVLIVSFIISSVGFKNYIWFFSVGYGFSIAGIGAALLAGFNSDIVLPEVLACLLLIVYGCRLGGYLLYREIKSSAYRKILDPEIERSKKMPVGAKLGLWIACAVLYTLMTSPLYFRLHNGSSPDVALWIGLVLMLCGFALEAIADYQKNKAKKSNSRRFVDTGVYRIVRCPNYLGELILWLGMFISGVTAMRGVLQWCAAILGFVLIVWVMFSGARRLELRQDRNYGDDPEYRKYVSSVPIILPLVPLYSVKKYKFLVA